MKNLLALIAIVALVGISFAQDLDKPQTGTAQSQQVQQQGGNSVYDQLVAIMLQKEQAYITGADPIEWNWMQWSISIQGGIWGGGQDATANAMMASLSPAEQAAFNVEAQQSWNRVIAAGLN